MNIKDFKWTEKRFGLTFANILKKLTGLSKDSTDGSIEYKDDDGNVSKLVTDSNFSSLLAKNGLIEVKWQELKDKRDNRQLIPGSLYRITDYQCTTTQENTQSAGHQFDIVLLALSEGKLAEEGWAMMNDNIYDVTFDDGVTKKCYVYDSGNGIYIVDAETLLGSRSPIADDEIEINEETKTAVTDAFKSYALNTADKPYNYFQNSNLSAWKVWYCLDNDKSRFAWADDASEESITPSESESSYVRDTNKDVDGLYAWTNDDSGDSIYTKTSNPIVGDKIYDDEGTSMQDTIGFISGFGRGVIYRLIDEFNNDVAYDFKNIQFIRKLNNGNYDPNNGKNTWVYTLNYYNVDKALCEDYSIVGNYYLNDENLISGCFNNHIGAIDAYTYGGALSSFMLSMNVLHSLGEAGNLCYGCNDINIIDSYNNTLSVSNVRGTELKSCLNCSCNSYSYIQLVNCNNVKVENRVTAYSLDSIILDDDGMYVNNKKVLTES